MLRFHVQAYCNRSRNAVLVKDLHLSVQPEVDHA